MSFQVQRGIPDHLYVLFDGGGPAGNTMFQANVFQISDNFNKANV
jgi:hypothetical protein